MGIYPSIDPSIGQVKPRSSTALVPPPRRGRGGGAWACIGQVKPRSSAASVPPLRRGGAAAAHGASHAEKTKAGRQ
tara:strand:- start:172 stop:399 length:228 start_codon:yes stop_codon:yes gene_type:complete